MSLLITAILFLIQGCLYRSKMLVDEPTFNGAALNKGGLALFGVIGSNLAYPVDTLQSYTVDSAMGQHLSNKLTATPISLPDSTKSLLTAPNYDLIKMQFEPSGEMNDKVNETLRGRQSYLPKYILLVFIEKDRTWDEVDKSGDAGTGYRYMTVLANIYEVATGKTVWSNRIKHGGYKSSKRNSSLKIAGVPTGGDNWSDGPPPPDALEVLGEIFDKLGDALAGRI